MSDHALLKEIGERLQQERLNQNMSQAELASAAGVSRKTITNLENGEGGTLPTLIAILRGLDRIDNLDAFLPDPGTSPLMLAEMQGKVRQRATGKRKKAKADYRVRESGWEWGEDS